MNSRLSNQPVILFAAIWVMLATLAAGTSAQSRSAPEGKLSDAFTEAMRSPFHVHRTPPGLPGPGLLLSAVEYRSAAQTPPAGFSMGLPVTGAPPQEAEPSSDRLVGLTTFGAVASHMATAYFLRCQGVFGDPLVDPGRYTGTGWPGSIGVPPGAGGRGCPFFEDHSDLVGSGFLLLVPTLATAGAAALGGSGFLRAVGGSALGFAGSLLFYKGMTGLTTDTLDRLPIPMWFFGGFMHGVTTAYFSNRGSRKGATQ